MPKNSHINYVEFKDNDLEEIKQFYSEAFGWSFTDYGPTYVAFSHSGIEGGFEKTKNYKINYIMKLKSLVPALFFLFALTGIAQNTENNATVDNRYFSLSFGLNAIDNSNGSVLPFDGNGLNFS